LEFILRSLVELKLNVEDLRRRMDEASAAVVRAPAETWIGDSTVVAAGPGGRGPLPTGAILPRSGGADEEVVFRPGVTMAQVERLAIESTLRSTRGNRRRAAEILQIGERTMYRKIREYESESGIRIWEGDDAAEDGSEAP
jgi:DNA-binding NtrC family response regulator